jgi:hypothetical protein
MHNSLLGGYYSTLHGVFGKAWTDLTSPTSPHSVFQPNPFQQQENLDKKEENDWLD